MASPASHYLQEQLSISLMPLPLGLKSLPSLCFTLPGDSSQRCLGIHFLKHDLSQQHLILQLSSSLSSLYLLASTIRLGRGCNFRQCNVFKGWMGKRRASLGLSMFGRAPQPVVLESSGLLLRGPQKVTKKANLPACIIHFNSIASYWKFFRGSMKI